MVELKKKVTLKTKTSDANPEPPVSPTPPDGGGSRGGAGKWIAIIVGIVLVIGVIYYFTQKDDGGDTPAQPAATLVADSTQSEQADPTAAAADSTKSDEATADDDVTPTAADTTQPSQAAEAQPEARQAAEVSGDTESLAREVIRGKYGNGAVRKQRLGGSYAEVQAKVNEMYRNGLVN